MNLLIVPDIFGATPALDGLVKDLTTAASWGAAPPEILDPYGDGCWFQEEAAAYAHFSACLGVEAYAAKLAAYLADRPGPWVVLGFSAGASAIWHLAGTAGCPRVLGAIGLYGSQIRNFVHLSPAFPMHLIFPESEPHFDVDFLMAVLGAKPGTACQKAPGLHGFMNGLSVNYDPVLYDLYVRQILPGLIKAFPRH